jgi:hypothetical protein
MNATIKNCWLKAGIMPKYGELSDDESVDCKAYENNTDIQLGLRSGWFRPVFMKTNTELN